MSIIKVNSEMIAEVRNALCIIQLNASIVTDSSSCKYRVHPDINCYAIIKQVKRIDKMLPKVAFEGGK